MLIIEQKKMKIHYWTLNSVLFWCYENSTPVYIRNTCLPIMVWQCCNNLCIDAMIHWVTILFGLIYCVAALFVVIHCVALNCIRRALSGFGGIGINCSPVYYCNTWLVRMVLWCFNTFIVHIVYYKPLCTDTLCGSNELY